MNADDFNILSLDGGGSKGVYTLGILVELESLLSAPLHQHFELIYGVSTGAIIACLLGLGHTAAEIRDMYFQIVPEIMKPFSKSGRSAKLKEKSNQIFADRTFSDMKTYVGVVTTHSEFRRPHIFKSSSDQSINRSSSFIPGFGSSVCEAVVASCSAFPFFEKSELMTNKFSSKTLLDGGFVANNPALFAVSDAISGLNISLDRLTLLSLGTGRFPTPKRMGIIRWFRGIWPFELLQMVLESNSNSHEKLRSLLLPDLRCVRISESYSDPKFAVDLLENDTKKLNQLYQLGRDSFGKFESQIRDLYPRN